MTTIAYRDGVLAGDGRVTVSDTVVSSSSRKVHRLKDGRLFGWSGRVQGGEDLHQSLLNNAETPILKGVNAIMINSQGQLFFYEGVSWRKQNEPYYSIGSGSVFALGAMDHGASAAEAVKIASKRDVSSGGKVRTVKLKGHK